MRCRDSSVRSFSVGKRWGDPVAQLRRAASLLNRNGSVGELKPGNEESGKPQPTERLPRSSVEEGDPPQDSSNCKQGHSTGQSVGHAVHPVDPSLLGARAHFATENLSARKGIHSPLC